MLTKSTADRVYVTKAMCEKRHKTCQFTDCVKVPVNATPELYETVIFLEKGFFQGVKESVMFDVGGKVSLKKARARTRGQNPGLL